MYCQPATQMDRNASQIMSNSASQLVQPPSVSQSDSVPPLTTGVMSASQLPQQLHISPPAHAASIQPASFSCSNSCWAQPRQALCRGHSQLLSPSMREKEGSLLHATASGSMWQTRIIHLQIKREENRKLISVNPIRVITVFSFQKVSFRVVVIVKASYAKEGI